MAKVLLITGGAATGKTRWAVSYFEACDNVLYLCVSENMEKDILKRINYSNNAHGIEWNIVTNAMQPVQHVDGHKFVIFDNIASYVSRFIKEKCPDISLMTDDLMHSIQNDIINDISDLMESVKEIGGNLLIITLETGFSVCPDNKEQMMFREILGTVNQRIANKATEAYLSVSGIQYKIKG